MNKMKAFTLTESLIMIAIVGVIATITMVSLAGLKPNKDKMLLQKAYKATMSAVAELTNDPVAYPPLKSAMNQDVVFSLNKQKTLAQLMCLTDKTRMNDHGIIENVATTNCKTNLAQFETCLRLDENDECVNNTTPLTFTGRPRTFTFTLPTTTTGSGGSSTNSEAIGGNTGVSVSGSNNNGGFVLPDVGTASTGKTGNSSANVTITKASAALTDRSIPTRDTGKYTATNKFAYLFSNKIIANESVSSSSVSCSGATCTFRTNDGMSWTVTDGFSANNVNSTSTVVVDINGSKGPNKSYNPSKPTEVKTPDRFTFTIRANGQVVIASNDAVAVKYLNNRNYK